MQKYVDKYNYGAGFSVNATRGFFARPVGLTEEDYEALRKMQGDFAVVQRWLDFVYNQASRREYVPEIPKEIEDILCLYRAKEEKPSKPDTAAGSSTGSRSSSKKKASTSATKKKASRSSSQPAEATDAAAVSSPTE